MRRSIRFPLSLSLLLLSMGCYPNKATVDPWSYAPLSSSTPWIPPTTLSSLPLSTDPPEIPDQEDPLSLAELIDIALKNNLQTKVTWAQAQVSAANYGQSQSSFFPSLTGQFSYLRARQPVFDDDAPGGNFSPSGSRDLSRLSVNDIYYSLWSPQLSLSYLIYDFGTSRASSEAARQTLYAADWNHNEAILSVLQQVMTDFYSYLYQDELLTADQADVDTATLTLNAAIAGFDSGVRDVSDVLQSKTQLLQHQTSWSGQKQHVETSYTTLLNAMGLPATLKLKTQSFSDKLPSKDILPPTETLIAVALQNRPDFMAHEANVRSAQQNVIVAKRQYLPQFTYDLEIGRNYYNKGLHDKYNFMSTFAVSMPLFKGFFYRNAIKSAKAKEKVATEQLKQNQLDIIQQVTTYHYNVDIAFETLKFAQGFLVAAGEQYDVALSQYKQGTNSILDVVSAQSSLADARAKLASSLDRWYTSLANLAYSTGLLSPTKLAVFDQLEEVKIAQTEDSLP